MKRFYRIPAVFFAFALCLSCGIDSSDPITLGPDNFTTLTLTFNTRAEIAPLSYDPPEDWSDFDKDKLGSTIRYVVYYKIYISSANETGTIPIDRLSEINPTLAADYNAILPYTPDSKTTEALPVFSPNVFTSRGFYSLYLRSTVGNNVFDDEYVSNAVLLTIDFSGNPTGDPDDTIDGTKPYIDYNNENDKYQLVRSNGGGVFKPQPEERYFINSGELNDPANITSSINADVSNSNPPDAATRNAYCAIYLVRRGFVISSTTVAPIYGNPTFITLFRLPE